MYLNTGAMEFNSYRAVNELSKGFLLILKHYVSILGIYIAYSVFISGVVLAGLSTSTLVVTNLQIFLAEFSLFS